MNRSALIVGAGSGLGSSLALRCADLGMDVALAARDIAGLADLSRRTSASLH
jgi:Short-chain dehydrogenases of various substrate specificities